MLLCEFFARHAYLRVGKATDKVAGVAVEFTPRRGVFHTSKRLIVWHETPTPLEASETVHVRSEKETEHEGVRLRTSEERLAPGWFVRSTLPVGRSETHRISQ